MIDSAPDGVEKRGTSAMTGSVRSRLRRRKGAEFAAVLAGRTENPGAQLAAYVYRRRAVDPRAGDDITRPALIGAPLFHSS
jgi:hypothetical protein